tara:strand:- start:305 stop:412 length:108 start_codon:yes stop_codon:yes gene_type:complete
MKPFEVVFTQMTPPDKQRFSVKLVDWILEDSQIKK